MILAIFTKFIENFNNNVKDSLYDIIPLNYIFIFVIVIFVLVAILVFSTLILPLFKKSSKRLYNRYLFLRNEMKRVDTLYSQKKIIFDEYVSLQFQNAQEYYQIVKILSSDPKFKSKLQSYTLQDNLSKPTPPLKRPLTKEEKDLQQIEKLTSVLKPKASNFTKEDIYSVLLYEGFEENIIQGVLRALVSQNVIFSKVSSTENKKDLSSFLDNLIKGKESDLKNQGETSQSISFDKNKDNEFFKEDFKRKELNFDNIKDVDYTFKVEEEKEEKVGFFKRLFGKKKKPPVKASITEVDSILKNIEKELKTKEI
ncbi:MAG: hypothetical protein PHX47_00110 [Candidatus ainarchaeum sp.]|nr:hypothetical protein [Candidatus ainarchaeum sp.]